MENLGIVPVPSYQTAGTVTQKPVLPEAFIKRRSSKGAFVNQGESTEMTHVLMKLALGIRLSIDCYWFTDRKWQCEQSLSFTHWLIERPVCCRSIRPVQPENGARLHVSSNVVWISA
jgi:hypothetical protein